MEFLELSDVKDGDQIARVEFRCGFRHEDKSICNNYFDTMLTGKIDLMRMGQIIQNRCERCGNYSGLELSPTKPDTGKRTQLLDLLKSLTHMTRENRMRLEHLINGTNLRVRFAVK